MFISPHVALLAKSLDTPGLELEKCIAKCCNCPGPHCSFDIKNLTLESCGEMVNVRHKALVINFQVQGTMLKAHFIYIYF